VPCSVPLGLGGQEHRVSDQVGDDDIHRRRASTQSRRRGQLPVSLLPLCSDSASGGASVSLCTAAPAMYRWSGA
jgi:hypothetical protein